MLCNLQYMRGMKQVRRKAVREDPRLRTLVVKVDSLVWELDATSIRTVAWAHQRQKLGSPNLPRLVHPHSDRKYSCINVLIGHLIAYSADRVLV